MGKLLNKRRTIVVAAAAVSAGLLTGLAWVAPWPHGAVPQVMAQQSELPQVPAAGKQGNAGIYVAYPGNGAEITAPTTFIAGAVPPRSTLTINGADVKLNKEGFFCQVVAVPTGESRFVLERNGNPAMARDINVHRALPPQPVPHDPLQILKTSIEPRQDLGVSPGDLVQFAMRASSGGTACVKIGAAVIDLQPSTRASRINRGLDTAYGITYQKGPEVLGDLYTGYYRVSSADCWNRERPTFQIQRDGAADQVLSESGITVLHQPCLSSTAHDNTIVRTGPDASRTTPWTAGVRVLVDGFSGEWSRCEMAPGKHLWVNSRDLSGNEQTGTLPTSQVRTINIEDEGERGARVSVPLNQRLPFEIKQEISPLNRLQLTIYGATANTDWITEPGSAVSTAAQPQARQGRAFPRASDRSKNPVSFITWQQNSDRVFRCTVNLSSKQQWGFWPEYRDTTLVLHIKGAPHLASGTLRGLKICLDPGHGGAETGAIGCSGVKESTINLAIAKNLASLLSARGAKVVMTRAADVEVSLADRVKMAVDSDCQLLVSVHCNSLPDGRNPWVEHGTSSYYYHPQSLKMAMAIRRGAVASLKFNDFHTRWQNLALCRPSQMPAALIEVGFVINPDEYAVLISPSGQKKAAQGIAAGLQAFLKDTTLKASATGRRKAG